MNNSETGVKHLLMLDGRAHVTVRFLAARFSVPADTFQAAIEAEYIRSGTGPFSDGSNQWLDVGSFCDLTDETELSPFFPGKRWRAVVSLLNGFKEKAA